MVAPPRRAREQRLVLKPRELSRSQVLALIKQRGWAAVGMPSQRQLLVGPRGRTVAYVAGKSLIVRDRSGRVRMLRDVVGDFRYSADGRYLSAMSRKSGRFTLRLLDVRTSRWRVLGTLPNAYWMEWSRRGPLVSYWDTHSRRYVLELFPLQGKRRVVASASNLVARRFFSAVRGYRVAFMIGRVLHTADVRRPGKSQPALTLPGWVVNGDMSPDGGAVAIVTSAGFYRYTLGATPVKTELLDASKTVHSVWFDRDGALAWANPKGAHRLRGAVKRSFWASRGEPIKTMRLHRSSKDGLLVVTQRRVRVVSMRDARPSARVLAVVGSGVQLVSSDDYEGGTLLWSAKPIPFVIGKRQRAALTRLRGLGLLQRQQARAR
ncbi:MAG: hypothetical protein KC503_04965 [Myxococcales bacterium]|nr:hypothetical protein [Myxococcales bacterium]